MLITFVPVAPLRAEASHRSEMVSQLLFGELCEPLETNGDFVRVRSLYDNYEGWCQTVQLHPYNGAAAGALALAGGWVNDVSINGQVCHVPFGSSLQFVQNGQATVGNASVAFAGTILQPMQWDSAKMEEIARLFLHVPYLWGGRSVFGIDCSGFTQLVFKCFGRYLHRDAYQQATQGEAVGFLQETQPGDLAFFDNAEGRITHVGILLSPDTIIHASGRVRIDRVDNMGIVQTDTGRRTHQLRIIKRIE